MKIQQFGRMHWKLVPATAGEKAAYKHFKEEMLPQMEKAGRKLFEPRVRGFANKLIPAPKQNPCDICKEAQYNKLCPEAGDCGPLLYAMLWEVHNIDSRSRRMMKKGKKCSARSAKRSSRTRKTPGA